MKTCDCDDHLPYYGHMYIVVQWYKDLAFGARAHLVCWFLEKKNSFAHAYSYRNHNFFYCA